MKWVKKRGVWWTQTEEEEGVKQSKGMNVNVSSLSLLCVPHLLHMSLLDDYCAVDQNMTPLLPWFCLLNWSLSFWTVLVFLPLVIRPKWLSSSCLVCQMMNPVTRRWRRRRGVTKHFCSFTLFSSQLSVDVFSLPMGFLLLSLLRRMKERRCK